MIHVWDVASGTLLHEIKGLGHAGGPISGLRNPHEYLAVAPDGRLFATAAWLATEKGDQWVRVWETATGKLVHQHAARQRISPRFAFAPAGGLLFTLDGTQIGKGDVLNLIDPTSGDTRWTLDLKDTHAASIAFSADGQSLAIGGDDGSLRLYETATGRLRHVFKGHARTVNGVGFTADGALLAASSLDAPVFLWDVYGTHVKKPRPEEWSAAEAQQLWQDLATPDGPFAFELVRRLVQNPQAAVSLLRERVRPVGEVTEQRFQVLLRDLDSDDFEIRQPAATELEQLAERIEFRLRAAAQQEGRPLEVKRRLEMLVKKLDPPTPDRLRQARAVEALEQIATPQALQQVEELAAGERGARLTRGAAAALERMRRH